VSDFAAGYRRGLEQAIYICDTAAKAYNAGAGAAHPVEARELAKAQALRCAEEIRCVLDKFLKLNEMMNDV
jgi:hypothetical protein